MRIGKLAGLFMLFASTVWSQNLKSEFDFGFNIAPAFYANMTENISYPSQILKSPLVANADPEGTSASFLEIEVLMPISANSGLSFLIGANLMPDSRLFQYSSKFESYAGSSYTIESRTDGGCVYFGLNADKYVFSWVGLYGRASIGYFIFEQRVHVIEEVPSSSAEAFYTYINNQFGGKSSTGIFFDIVGIKIRSGFAYQVTGNKDNNSFIRAMGFELKVGFAF